MSDREMFPIMNSPTLRAVPWSLMAPAEVSVRRNHMQTLERLAQRGGLSACEALCALRGDDIRTIFRNPHGQRRVPGGAVSRCNCVEVLSQLALDHVAAEAHATKDAP